MNFQCGDNDLRSTLDSMILSASGWRKVFAPGGEHSPAPIPAAADLLLAVGMGQTWGTWLKNRLGRDSVVVLAATDTRPTGPVLADMLIRGLKSTGCKVIYIGVAAAPEAMARCGTDGSIDAFAYISASHNPLGHNGVKFGLGGGVIGGSDAEDLITRYRSLIGADGEAERLAEIASSADTVRTPDTEEKRLTLAAYKKCLELIAGGPGVEDSRRETLSALRKALDAKPVTIVADLNGSARCLSVDRPYLENLGAALVTFNDRAGVIAHAILPEGESLEPCRQALEKAHAEDSSALIGYVPDNDGDRGNLVIWDETIKGARILEAQEVFALSTLAEFASAAWAEAESPTGGQQKTALVVNGPTSHRVRFIAEAFGAEVHEAEVGEANAVNRAAELRREGYRVRLLGEGSNGGTIIHPAEVRDPLNTVTALLKLLRLPSAPGRPAPFEDWCRRIGKPELYREDFGPAEVLAALPAYTTTPASTDRAIMKITAGDHGALKTEWEKLFLDQWNRHADSLRQTYGFASWIEVNNEGTCSRIGTGTDARSGAQTGGLKVVFRDKTGRDAGFIWMRGSGTEPVFRVMAEIRGKRPEAEAALIKWHRGMVAEADRRISGVTEEPVSIPYPVRNPCR